MSKCKTHKCHACCCYNIPFQCNELEKYKDKIVTPVIATRRIGAFGVLAITTTLCDINDKNRCPFLRKDYRCNIYEDRPSVCRKFGEIEELKCQFRK